MKPKPQAASRRYRCCECEFRGPRGQCLDPVLEKGLKTGLCGDWVYYVRGGKQRRRLHCIPRDPRTPAQLRCRAALGAASRNYSSVLTDEEQDACIAAGAKLRTRERLGCGPLTGQQCYVRPQCRQPKPEPQSAASGREETTATLEVPQLQAITIHMGTTPDPRRLRERSTPGSRRAQRVPHDGKRQDYLTIKDS